MGYTAGNMKAAYYAASDLKEAGFSARELKEAGYPKGAPSFKMKRLMKAADRILRRLPLP